MDGLEMTIIYLLLLLSACNVLGAMLDVCGTQTYKTSRVNLLWVVEVKSSFFCSSHKREHLPQGPNMVPEFPSPAHPPPLAVPPWGASRRSCVSELRHLITWEE